jgi:hypothetical protein
VRQGLWFQQDGAPAYYGGIVRQWLNATYPGRWTGLWGPIAWPSRSSDPTPVVFFLLWQRRENADVVSSRITAGFVARLQCRQVWQRSMPAYYGVFEGVPFGSLPSAWKWTKAAPNTSCNYEATIIRSVDSLCHLTVTCVLKTKRHRAYVLQYVWLFFNKKSHYGQFASEFH